MTHDESERLFIRVKKRFNTNDIFASGYVHGVSDGMDANRPKPKYGHDFFASSDQAPTVYAKGYIFGYVDAYGEDVFRNFRDFHVFRVIAKRPASFRWWLYESD